MKQATLTFPKIGLIAATRGMIGAGAALLLADKLPAERRKAIGWPLLLVGALSTIPLAVSVIKKTQAAGSNEPMARGRSTSG
jgi:hypothetical protein